MQIIPGNECASISDHRHHVCCPDLQFQLPGAGQILPEQKGRPPLKSPAKPYEEEPPKNAVSNTFEGFIFLACRKNEFISPWE